MKTFELSEVRAFANDVSQKLNRCFYSDGDKFANLDDALACYADLCNLYRDRIREWGRAVFAGRVEFDSEVEATWLSRGEILCRKAKLTLDSAPSGPPNDEDPGLLRLHVAMFQLETLLDRWVSPRKSVGPAARLGLPRDEAVVDEMRRKLRSLPPLPADWEPIDPEQRARFKKIRNS